MTDNKLEKLAEIRNYINDVLCFPLFNFEQLYAMVVLRFDIPDDEAKKITWEYILEKARIGYTLPLLEEVKREGRQEVVEWVNKHFHTNTGYEAALYLWDKRDWQSKLKEWGLQQGKEGE